MSDLLIRDLDKDLRSAMEAMAKAEKRSLSDIAKRLLQRGVSGLAAGGGQPSRGLGSRLAALGRLRGGFGDLVPPRDDLGREAPFSR